MRREKSRIRLGFFGKFPAQRKQGIFRGDQGITLEDQGFSGRDQGNQLFRNTTALRVHVRTKGSTTLNGVSFAAAPSVIDPVDLENRVNLLPETVKALRDLGVPAAMELPEETIKSVPASNSGTNDRYQSEEQGGIEDETTE